MEINIVVLLRWLMQFVRFKATSTGSEKEHISWRKSRISWVFPNTASFVSTQPAGPQHITCWRGSWNKAKPSLLFVLAPGMMLFIHPPWTWVKWGKYGTSFVHFKKPQSACLVKSIHNIVGNDLFKYLHFHMH